MKLNFPRIFILVGLISLGLIFPISWLNMTSDYSLMVRSDFLGIYSFGRISQTEGPEHIYNLELQENIRQEVSGYKSLYRHFTHVPLIAALAMGLNGALTALLVPLLANWLSAAGG